MRFGSNLILALAVSTLAVGPMGCTSSSWCATCDQATPILGLNYQASSTYTVGTPIPTNPPNPSGGTPRLYEVASGSLPPGLSLDPTTGRITGTPTTAGVTTLSIRATNASNSATQTIQITVVPVLPMALTYTTPQVFPASVSISVQTPALVQETPGVPTTYAVTSGDLPVGLILNGDGTISGTPTSPRVHAFTVTATNGARSAMASAQYTVTPIGSLGLAYATPLTFTAGTAISTQLPALTNPIPGLPTTFTNTSGHLPGGLTLNADGSITGTPTTAGVYTFAITATNGSRPSVSATVTYTVNPAANLTLSYTTPQTHTVGSAIATQSATLAHANPDLTTTYAKTSGNLPGGLTLNADGTITGTPTAPGVFTFIITATNGNRPAAVSATITYTINPAANLLLNYTSPQTFPQGTVISTQLPALANENPGFATTYVKTSGNLPGGLALNADGTITGTPTTAGVFTFTVTATNGTRTPATATATYTVNPVANLGLSYATPLTVPSGSTIAGQSPTLSNSNPGLSTTYAITVGSLPAGLSIDGSTGIISGTPSTAGVSTFTVTATNGTRTPATATATYTVNPVANLDLSYATPLTVPTGSAIASQSPTLSNSNPGLGATYAVTVGSLPAGLSIDGSTGIISGTPSTAGVSTFTVTATNGTRTPATATATYTVNPAANLTLSYPTPLSVPIGSAIASQSPTLSSSNPGLSTTYAITVGSLPAGLSMNSGTGIISGTPSAVGVTTFTVTATNGTRTPATATATYTVNPVANLGLSYATPLTIPTGSPIASQSPTLSNSNPGLSTTYAITVGSLPAGLSLNSATGIISGTPSAVGVTTFTVTATNGTRTPATVTATYIVNPAANLTLSYVTPRTFTAGTVIAAQNPTLANANPGLSTTYAVTVGSLPAGLSIDGATGIISGTPSTAGVFTFTVTATNGTRTPATATATYTVNPGAPTALNYATPVTYTSGVAIANNNPNPSGGLPSSYTISSGALPGGLSLNISTGVISGTPTTAGSFSVTISGSNITGGTSQTVPITVLVPLIGSLSANPALISVGQATSLTAIFSGGTASIDQGFGAVTSGTSLPTAAYASPGTYTYTLTISNGFDSITHTASVTVVTTPPNSINITVPMGGVTSTVNSPGSPLDGLSVVVPNQGSAVCASTTLTVTREVGSPMPGTLASGVIAVSDPWTFSTTVGHPFRTPMTVTLPYDGAALSAGDVPVPFYWEPAYGKWVSVGLKSVDTTNKRVTFTTLLPGEYAVLAIPGLSASLSTQNLGFASGTDGWFQPNQGAFDVPGGAGLGMSAYAAWYFGFKKSDNGNAGLSTLLRQGDVNSAADDANARALISRLGNGTLESWNQLWSQGAYQLNNLQTGLALVTGLRVTAQPQIFFMSEARPGVSNGLATVVTGYNQATGKFTVLDPNYPGAPLTITWNSGTGAFTAYDRAAAYVPTFAQYAYEGQTSIHRLSDYERVFNGANAGWGNPPFAAVSITDVAGTGSPAAGLSTVASGTSVAVAGSVANGDAAASHVYWSQNGGAKTPVVLSSGAFNFTIPTLSDPYGTRIAIETTGNPCDPTFSSTGYSEFTVKVTGKTPWFPNVCFESGSLTPWTLEQGSNNGGTKWYPTTPIWDPVTGEISNYGIVWDGAFIESATVTSGNDPNVSSIPQVYDGSWAFRINNSATGAHISRVQQVITIPSDVAVPKLTFAWAAVMQDPGHSAAEQPFVDIIVEDVTNANERVYYKHFYANDPSYPGWVAGTGLWKGIAWQLVNLTDLSTRKGHQLRIRVVAADCTQTGHGGYAYLDGVNCN